MQQPTLEDKINTFDKFCSRPFTELVLWYDKTYKPCCVFDPMHEYSISPDHIDIKEIWNSKYLVDIRKKFMNNEFPKQCNHCERTELRGDSSLRNESNLLLFNNQGNKNIIIDTEAGALPYNLPLKIEWRIGNSCNMSCRMCFPLVSSSIAKEYIENKELFDKVLKTNPAPYTLEHENKRNNTEINQVTLTGVNDWLEEKTVDDICKQYSNNRESLLNVRTKKDHINNNAYLPQWSIVGGEPTVTPGFYTILEKIKEYNIQDLIQVVIITNGLVFNQKLVDLLTGIGEIEVTISIDGTRDVHNYIRYKRSFDRILHNIKKYESIGCQGLTIETTISSLNLFDVPDWCNYITETELLLDKKTNQHDIGFHIVENPDLNLYTIPLSIRKEFKPKLQEAYDNMNGEVRNLKAIISNIDLSADELPESYKKEGALKMFADRTLMLDKVRGQDIFSIDKYGYFKQMIDMVKNDNN